ncbi:tyrosine-type recombinase/integrase [Chryseobacterium rhizosphaerae]|uniref:tyrosine-type recombinase/integrase n=1 Tax=Chryseobacterium TaxID=59732 RepID=UPI0023594086|nr:tyrosine-type recombinase/integrase [Chryseobacterium rhizosphaerae]MDC8099471.1 site-specific integrase [Chryseobacterium rhizosphaerae]WPO92638.1 tyrosine-type recombinase/integrase [Chryseobacterium sp. HR92]
MTINFFLPHNSLLKNIHISITDERYEIDSQFRTPFSISDEEWDFGKQRPKNIYLKKNKKLNSKLDHLKIRIRQYINERYIKKKSLNQRILSKQIQKINAENQELYPENSLLYFLKNYIESRQEMICESTFKRYNVFYRLIKRFEGFMMKRLFIEDINSDFVKDFILFGKDEQYSENTIYRSIHFIKTILNFVERKGIRTSVRQLEIRREKQHRQIITLTEEEIRRIKSTDFPSELSEAKDWLLISCYTGQRISDFMDFSLDKLKQINGKTCINFIQRKTNKEILLPLHPTVLNVIRRNAGCFPGSIDYQTYNRKIKEVARLAGLNQFIKARKRVGHRVRNVVIEKWQVLTSHVGRRSFATNFFGKIPTPLLMEATGHGTEQMFMKYINSINNERVICLSNYFDKVYEEMLECVG